ncbi:hypothetical protein BDV27DRAFT_161245 [Aspergillus caelatus]|uniref:Carrier domain-containing protein n=1 Tax=Aspergillus caelatus TaxID=61420 RepID=A0A5N6ZVB9_9EURO|nr:uncharacterized protein BDV27DRAFT_161245 [Aspergillus caelatus]KAE8360869.1 hypothetical protein BDV27DRAFT_161245 [Aspergillus caelatus]
MAPDLWIPLAHLPKAASGKIDRRLLRDTAAAMSQRDLYAFAGSLTEKRAPATSSERTLQQVYADILQVPPTAIDMDDTFLRLGGDSAQAIRLVRAARKAGLTVQMQEVLAKVSIADQADKAITIASLPEAIYEPFSLVGASVQADVLRLGQEQCRVQRSQIEDIYPCTPLQESMYSSSLQHPGMYTGNIVFRIPLGVDISRLKHAWKDTADNNPILRTRIIQTSHGFFQVVVDTFAWREHTGSILATPGFTELVGQPLVQYLHKEKDRELVLTSHHAVSDDWALRLVLQQVEAAYQGHLLEKQHFHPFIQYTQNLRGVEEFWATQLSELDAASLQHQIEGLCVNKRTPHTLPTYIYLAWALLIAHYTDSPDVVYGATLSGRNASVPAIEAMVGPTITTLPLRVQLQSGISVVTALDQVQKTLASMIPYEQAGLPRIARSCQDGTRACQFHNQLIIQSPEETDHTSLFEIVQASAHTGLDYTTFCGFAMMLSVLPSADRTRMAIDTAFDPHVVSPDAVSVYAHSASDPAAACAADRNNLGGLCSSLAYRLSLLDMHPSSSVGICLERSKWSVAAILAVLRAGGTCILLDLHHPRQRIHDILKETSVQVMINSQAMAAVTSGLTPIEVRLDPAITELLPQTPTGRPKGIVMPHSTLASSIKYHSAPMNVGADSRVLHFSSYAFDVSIYEIFTTLAAGATLCIPSEFERKNALAETIRRFQANWAFLTPSTVQTLQPSEVPCLSTLVLGGEAVTRENVDVWAPGRTLVNGYGPAEATICGVGTIPPTGWKPGLIGSIVGGVGWVTMPTDTSQLAAIGAIGELLLEGPFLAAGYFNLPDVTAASFMKSPAWRQTMPLGPSSGLYRTGDLVQYQDDGTIRYMGRQGTRMKLHGQLIELGEIETNTLHEFLAANGVATARRAGLNFTVADVLSPSSSLSSLALSLLEVRPGQEKPVLSAPAQPSILTSVGFQQHLSSLQQQGIPPLAGNVTSARPATEAQSILVSRYLWFNFQFPFQGKLNEDRLRDACRALVRAHSVLRVVFTKYREDLVQLTLAEDMDLPLQVVTTHNQLDSFCESLCHSEQAVSVPSAGVATRFTLVSNPMHTDQRLIIRLAHAQYDAISIPILVHDLESVYNDGKKIADTSFDRCLEQRARHSDQEQQRAFWQEYLAGSSPLTSSPLDLTSATHLVTGTCDIALPARLPPSVTLPTVVKAAASLVLARHLHRPDIVIGQIVDGRSLPFPDVDRVVGAFNNYIPFRVQPRASMTVRDYLLHAQSQHARSLGSESVDLRTIVSHCTDWPSSTEFGYIVQHQTANHGLTLTLGSKSSSLKLVGSLSPGSEVWICSTETPSGVRIDIHSSAQRMSLDRVTSMACDVCAMINDLLTKLDGYLCAIEGITFLS